MRFACPRLVAVMFLLPGCSTVASRPVIDAADNGKTCRQLLSESGQLAQEAVQHSSKVREMKERQNAYSVTSYIPIVGGLAGVADMVGDASGSRAGAKAQEDRDWATARSAYLHDLAMERCPPVQVMQDAPPGDGVEARH